MFCGIKNQWLELAVIMGLMLLISVSEIVTDWTVFTSLFNYYHS